MMEVVMVAWRYNTVSVDEIAAILPGGHAGTVRNHLARFRAKLNVQTTWQGLHKADALGLCEGRRLGEALLPPPKETGGQ